MKAATLTVQSVQKINGLISNNTSIRRIPYLLEREALKSIINFLKEQSEPFKTDNGKLLDLQNEDIVYKIETKVARLNETELNLFLEKIEENGCGWGANYLVGGLRVEEHLCWVESKPVQEINNDHFLKINGISMF